MGYNLENLSWDAPASDLTQTKIEGFKAKARELAGRNPEVSKLLAQYALIVGVTTRVLLEEQEWTDEQAAQDIQDAGGDFPSVAEVSLQAFDANTEPQSIRVYRTIAAEKPEIVNQSRAEVVQRFVRRMVIEYDGLPVVEALEKSDGATHVDILHSDMFDEVADLNPDDLARFHGLLVLCSLFAGSLRE